MDRFVKKTARGPGNSLPSHLIKSSSMSIDRYLVKTRRVSNTKDRDKRSSREDDDECCARDDSEEICVLDETDHSVSASNSTVLKTSSGTNSGRSRWKSSSSGKKQSTIHSLPVSTSLTLVWLDYVFMMSRMLSLHRTKCPISLLINQCEDKPFRQQIILELI